MSITQTLQTKQTKSWQQALKTLITTPEELLFELKLTPKQLNWESIPQFPLRVSRSFVAKMKVGDPNDPLLKQILPTQNESQLTFGYERDPLKERDSNPVPGLLHKFHGRVLLTLTQSCPVHCRYCFRRYFPYNENRLSAQNLSNIKQYIQSDESIQEIIFSGGDPLMLSDTQLSDLLTSLEEIKHLKIVRFHTRFPVIVPERITDLLIDSLAKTRFHKVFVYHINHPQEICDEIKIGVQKLTKTQVTVLNQSVLLSGINDVEETLIALSWKLFQTGILPYYIHTLDKVQGTAHFAVENNRIEQLQIALKNHLPGYLVPKIVKEVPKALSKVHLF